LLKTLFLVEKHGSGETEESGAEVETWVEVAAAATVLVAGVAAAATVLVAGVASAKVAQALAKEVQSRAAVTAWSTGTVADADLPSRGSSGGGPPYNFAKEQTFLVGCHVYSRTNKQFGHKSRPQKI
jgi:hypothetical protein